MLVTCSLLPGQKLVQTSAGKEDEEGKREREHSFLACTPGVSAFRYGWIQRHKCRPALPLDLPSIRVTAFLSVDGLCYYGRDYR